MSSDDLVYLKKFLWLPYGQRMIQVFCIKKGVIQKTICFNEFLIKSFEINDLVGFQLLDSSDTLPSNVEEFLNFENYL